MKTYLVAFFLSALIAIALTPIVRRLAPKVGAIDLPSGRRVNKRITPRLGGVAILVGFVAPLLGLIFYDNDISILFWDDYTRALALLGGALAMLLLGAADDLKGVRAWIKLITQIAVAVLAFVAGFRIESISLPYIGLLEMGIFSLPVTVFWIVGIINAVNLIDGLDGLAAGVAFFVCVVNFVVGLISNSILVSLFAVALGGALLGFLVFNFNPATIFMGDSGSMFIGFVLATSALFGSKGSTAIGLLVPILALGLPIMDTLLAIVRRFVSRQPIFTADRGHIHHKLLEMGVTHRRAVLILYGISVLFTVIAIVVYLGRQDWEVGVALIVATAVIFGMVRAVGTFQFRSIRRSQRESRYSEATNLLRRALPEFVNEARDAGGPAQLLEALERFARNSNLVLIEYSGAGVHFLEDWHFESTQFNGNNHTTRGYVSATYALKPDDKTEGKIKFGWYSDAGDVSPQSEMLLQVATDEIALRISLFSTTKDDT